MQSFRQLVLLGIFLLPWSVASPAPGSGSLWEITSKIEGMPMGMPATQVCMSKNEGEAPPAEDECTVLELRSQGNRHFMKAQCKDGLVEVDHSRTGNTLNQTTKMTDPDGNVYTMVQTGRLLGDCDYEANRRQMAAEVAAAQRTVDAAVAQGEAHLAQICAEAYASMQPATLMEDQWKCRQRVDWCRDINTFDGYRRANEGVNNQGGSANSYLDGFIRKCPADPVALRARHCGTAVDAGNLDFVAVACPEEQQALVQQHCAGRRYTSQIAAEWQQFCAGAMGNSSGSDATFTNDGSAETEEQEPPSATDKAKDGVKKGVDGIKKLFRF